MNKYKAKEFLSEYYALVLKHRIIWASSIHIYLKEIRDDETMSELRKFIENMKIE